MRFGPAQEEPHFLNIMICYIADEVNKNVNTQKFHLFVESYIVSIYNMSKGQNITNGGDVNVYHEIKRSRFEK